ENGATLNIEAGVVVNFDAAKNLSVTNGALVVRGTAGQPIVFTSTLDTAGSTPASGDWGQIRFLDGTNDTATVIEHAQVRYGHGIDVQSASPTFNYLDIRNSLGAAIAIDLSSSPKGLGNQASGNTLNGVSVPAGDVLGTVTWGIRGIPYVVASGIVSVGNSPVISTLNISEIQQGETLNALINGLRLAGALSVGVSTAGTTGIVQNGATDTTVPVQFMAASNAVLGTADVSLQVAAGRPSLPGALRVIQPQPAVTSLDPNSVYAVQTGNVLNVTGKNFVPESIVQLDGADLTTQYGSATSLSASLPVLAAGNKSITVKQPDPLSAGNFLISKPAVLNVNVPVLSLSPASVSQIKGVPFNLAVGIPFAAPTGGLTVNLSSGAAAVATVPATVTVAQGATTASFPVTTVGEGVVTITASATNFTSSTAQVQSLAPPTLSITSAKLVEVVGNNLTLAINSTVAAGTGGLTVSLTSSNTAVATVPASVTLPAGSKTANVAVAAVATGSATITAQANGYVTGSNVVTVRPVTQSVSVSPLPVAIPPDSLARKVTLKLAAVDAIDHVFSVSVSNTTVATAGATSVTIPAGQTTAQLPVTGLKEGTASISLVSPTLGTVVVPVYVTVEYAGINMSYASLVGVVKETPAVPPPQNAALLSSPHVGVAFGKYITGISPNLLTIGTGPTTVTVNGEGLQNATSVSITPGAGLTVGTFTPNPDGKSLTVPVTVAANAATTLRQVVVSGSAGQYNATTPDADRLLISLPLPEVTSVDPLFAVPGTASMTLAVRGRNFQGAQSISITAPDGIAIGGVPTVSTDGTYLTVTLGIASSAARGTRVVQVSTPAGTSDGTPGPNNTFTLVSQVQGAVTPITSPVVGLVKETVAPPPATQAYALYSLALGIAKGPAVSGVSPSVGAIGDTVAMTITGNELNNVTAVQFNPAAGLTVGTPVVAVDGKSMTVSVAIDPAAQLGARSLKVLAGTTALPFSGASDASFKVILPLAKLTSVEPIVVPIPATNFTLALNGSNFQNASEIRVTPNTGVTVANPPSVNANGTRATVAVTVAAAAAAGSRVVTIVTPAGESSAVADVSNTVTLTANPGSTYDSLASPVVGLVKETVVAPPAQTAITPASPVVGVVRETATVAAPASLSVFQPSPQVGVLFGSAAYTLAPEGLLAGSSGTLTVTGIGLDAATGASVSPATDVTLGALQASPDGTQLTIPVTLGANAAVGYRWVSLNRTGGTLNFAKPGMNAFWIATALPTLDSIAPILGQRGTTVSTVTIRGANLQNATAVVAEPPDGITFGVPAVDATGTVLTVGMAIDANAPTTARVIRVSTHGTMSSAVAAPANTFTVYP
ncbi:MAG TPA: IPT/TIG domain-containing protein, partial [Gallionella sp.]|nr:IPT/TIG domain-containing protein [Gallionella sp.]